MDSEYSEAKYSQKESVYKSVRLTVAEMKRPVSLIYTGKTPGLDQNPASWQVVCEGPSPPRENTRLGIQFR